MSQGTVTRRGHVGKRVLGAAVLLAVGVGGLFLAVQALQRVSGLPVGPGALLGRDPSLWRGFLFSVLVFWSALVPAVLAVQVLRRPRWLWTLPLAVGGAALVSWGLLRSCAAAEAVAGLLGVGPTDGIQPAKLIVPFVLACGSVMLAMVLAGGVAGAFLEYGVGKAARFALGLALVCAVLVGLAAVVGAAWQARRTMGHLPGAAAWARQAAAMGLVMLVSANAAAFAHVCVQSRPGALVVVLLATLVLAAVGWFLFQAALAGAVVHAPGIVPAAPAEAPLPAPPPMPGAEALLGGPLAGEVSKLSLALRWCLMQWGAVLVVSWGYLAALILLPVARAARGSPKPIGPQGPPSEADADAATPARPGRVYLLLTLAYAVFFFYGSLVPLRYRHMPLQRAWERFARLTWRSISVSHRSDLVANFVLSIPLMFFAMGAATQENRRRWARWVFAILLPAAGAGLACAMEFAQFYFPARTPSLNDIAAQSVGGVIGVALWLVFGSDITRWARSLWRQRAQQQAAVKLLAGYVVGLVIWQLWPFDLTISPAEVWHKLKAGRITLVPFADSMTLYIRCMKIALMVPVGYLVWMVSRSGRLWKSVGAGLLVAAGIEFGQLFVVSRFTSTTDVILGAAGAVVGAWLARGLSPQARRPWTRTAFWRQCAGALTLLMGLVWAGLLVWKEWAPFEFRWPAEGLVRQAGASLRVPFYHLYRKSAFAALTQAARRFGLFFILGVLVRSLTGPSRGGKWWAVCIACTAALAIEAGQLFVPGRVPDLATTAAIMALGGASGALAGSWLRGMLLAPRADAAV